MRAWVLAAVTLASTCATTSALAQRDPVLAETLFRQGRAAVESGDLATACAKFAESYRLDPAPGTLLNLADCEEKRGQLAGAWAHFHVLHDTLPPSDDRRAIAQSRADALAARLPRLKITLDAKAPHEARVFRDGEPVDPAALGVAVPIDPGKHVLVVRAPERVDATTKLELAAGDKREVVLDAGAPVPPPVVPPPPPPEHHGLVRQRVIAIVVAGGGVVLAGAGATFGGLALSSQGEADKLCTGGVCTAQRGIDLHETAKTEALVADVLFGTAVVAVAVGAVLWLTAKTPRAASAYVAPSFGGLALGGSF